MLDKFGRTRHIFKWNSTKDLYTQDYRGNLVQALCKNTLVFKKWSEKQEVQVKFMM